MVVEPPDADALSFPHLDDPSDAGMPDATERAFQSHYDAQLRPSGMVAQAKAEIERVYRCDADAVVSCSGGKDSLATLILASESDANHRALQWDYGPDFLPRRIEHEIVSAIREYVADERLFVANELMPVFKPYPEADAYHDQQQTEIRLPNAKSVRDDPGMRGVSRLAPRLRRSIERGIVGRQVLGTRKAESGSRDRYIDGLFGESMSNPAAFPIRDWTARDVWSLLVDRDAPYLSHYDKVAHATGDGAPEDYEAGRLGGLFRFMNGDADGLAHWRDRGIEARDWERETHRQQRGNNG